MKWSGIIGFEEQVLTAPGVYSTNITEKFFKGDILKNYRKTQSTENLNDNYLIANEISIIADPFSLNNFYKMKYVTYMGQKWKINSVTINHPRLNLSVGELYNE